MASRMSVSRHFSKIPAFWSARYFSHEGSSSNFEAQFICCWCCILKARNACQSCPPTWFASSCCYKLRSFLRVWATCFHSSRACCPIEAKSLESFAFAEFQFSCLLHDVTRHSSYCFVRISVVMLVGLQQFLQSNRI